MTLVNGKTFCAKVSLPPWNQPIGKGLTKGSRKKSSSSIGQAIKNGGGGGGGSDPDQVSRNRILLFPVGPGQLRQDPLLKFLLSVLISVYISDINRKKIKIF